MTKLRQYVRKASGWFIYLFLAAGFHNIIAGWVHAQAVSFVTAKKFSAGSAPTASRVGDFNRDGNQDLAVANSGSNDVSVLAGNGDGTFQTAVNFPVGGSPNSLVVGYFNGDSIQDLAVANSWPNPSISVLPGNGDGTFQPASIVPALPADASVQSIDVGDFNGDHLLDLIVGTNGIAVYLGNGNGTFRAPLITVGTNFFVIGYFNDDGILDIADADLFGVRVHKGNGDGTFQSPVTSPGVTGSLVVGYFNRDDIADLAVASFALLQPTVEILLGNGDGTFRSGGSFSGAFAANELVVDDFNGDNIADLANLSSGNVSVALGRGDGTFHTLALSFPVRFGVSLIVGEFNSDGRKDLAVTGDGGVSVALGYGDGTFQVTWNYELGEGLPSFVGSSTVALGEFNGDGIPDLAVAIASLPRRISVLLGNGDGSFQWAFDFPTGSDEANPACLAVGEFNRDGIQDLVIASPGSIGVLLGNGNGTFQPPVNFPAADNPSSIAVGYFNGDAFQDLAVVRFASGISVLLGNGDGTFRPPQLFDTGVPLVSGEQRAVAAGDFNGDGSQDLVATNAPAASISVLLGNGDGTFRAPLIFDAGGVPVSLAVGDFNNDRNQDLTMAHRSFPGISVLLGNGNGTFGMPSSFDVGARPDAIAVGDFNLDGIHDLAVASAYVSVLLGNGNGTFQPAVNFIVTGDSHSLVVGLLSGDGRPDIALAGSRRIARDRFYKVSVLINDTRY